MKKNILNILILLLFSIVLFANNTNPLKLNSFNDIRRSESLLNKKTGLENQLYDEAINLLEKSKPDQAIEKLFELLELEPEREFVFRINITLAEAYREKREYKKGVDLLYTVIEEKDLSQKDLTYAYTRIAAIYNEWKYPEDSFLDSVVLYSEMSIYISEIYIFDFSLALSQNELGHVMIQKGDYQKAKELLESALDIYKAIEKNNHAAGVAINLSNAFLYLDELEKAQQIIDEALYFCPEKGNENLFMRLYLHKAKVAQHKDEYEDAYSFLSKSRLYQKSFYEDRLDVEIIEMSARYDLELKDAKIREEQHKNEKKQNEVVTLLVLISILLLILFLGFLIFYLQRKNFKQKQKLSDMQKQILRKDYSAKNNELTNAIATGIAVDNILEEVKVEILNKKYSNAVNVINVGLSGDRKWQKFMLNFNRQNPSFLSKLQKKHPELTENESRLCAFLKIGLKTREIAAILNTEISGVNKARQRLRKKLHLELKEDLTDYLNTI